MATRLGLTATPRRAPLWKDFGLAGGERPDGRYSRLSPTGTPAKLQTFTAKEPASGSGSARPAGRYSVLGPSGTPLNPRPAFQPKAGAIGVAGRTTLDFAPSSVTVYGRRRTQLTDLVLSVKPVNAVITVAHTSARQGFTTVGFAPLATLRYTRFGRQYALQGNNTIDLATFGSIRVRYRHDTAGSTSLTVVPSSVRVYTPAPVRNHGILGRITLQLTAQADVAFAQNGLDFGIVGSSSIAMTVNGQVRVVRQTTYIQHGAVLLTVQPLGTITKGTGPPVAYAIQARTTIAVVPDAGLGFNVGDFEQHQIAASSNVIVLPRARITIRPAPSVTPLGTIRRGARRFIRVIRGRL